MFAEASKKIHEQEIISKDDCLNALRMHKRHKRNLEKCMKSEGDIQQEKYNYYMSKQSQSSISFGQGTGYPGVGTTGGYGVGFGYPGSGGYGMGGYGSAGIHSDLVMEKLNCEQFFGNDLLPKNKEVLEIDYSVIPEN